MSHHNSDKGYTLIELIIVTGVFSILVLVLGQFTVNSLTSFTYLQAQANTSTDLNNQIGRIGRVLRGTTSLTAASDNDLTLYGYFYPRDTTPDKIRYYINSAGDTLYADVTPASGTAPTYTYNPASTVTHTITTTLTTSPAPVFTYYDDAGAKLNSGFALSQVKQIGIFLSSNPKPSRLPAPISISTRVTLRNMKTNL